VRWAPTTCTLWKKSGPKWGDEAFSRLQGRLFSHDPHPSPQGFLDLGLDGLPLSVYLRIFPPFPGRLLLPLHQPFRLPHREPPGDYGGPGAQLASFSFQAKQGSGMPMVSAPPTAVAQGGLHLLTQVPDTKHNFGYTM
jgi:hypothetical protein